MDEPEERTIATADGVIRCGQKVLPQLTPFVQRRAATVALGDDTKVIHVQVILEDPKPAGQVDDPAQRRQPAVDRAGRRSVLGLIRSKRHRDRVGLATSLGSQERAGSPVVRDTKERRKHPAVMVPALRVFSHCASVMSAS